MTGTRPGRGQDETPHAVPIAEEAARLGISTEAVRKRIGRRSLTAYKVGDQWRIVLPAVQDAASRTRPDGGRAPVKDAADAIEAGYRVTPAEIEQAVLRTSTQYMGDLRAVLAEVGKVYEGQIAAKDETIAELRRRAEVAEAQLKQHTTVEAAPAAPGAPATGEPATRCPRALWGPVGACTGRTPRALLPACPRSSVFVPFAL